LKPLRYATWLSVIYLLVAGGYILVSSRLAAAIAHNVAQLERIEHIKGILFVVTTGAILWCTSLALFLKQAHTDEARALERRALTLVQGKAYAAELAAAVAHDFNNLLLVLRVGVEELTEELAQTPNNATLGEMRQALDSARNLTERMARAARGSRESRLAVHRLDRIVDDTIQLMRRLPRLQRCNLEVSLAAVPEARLDPILVEQIVVNLLLNAADAAGEDGTIRIVVEEHERAVCVAVHDSGKGLTALELKRALEPFFTTKSTGLGLGLFSVRASVDASEGNLALRSSPLGGALIEVNWPKLS